MARSIPPTPGASITVDKALRCSHQGPIVVQTGDGAFVVIGEQWYKLSTLTSGGVWQPVNLRWRNKREQHVTALALDLRPLVLDLLRVYLHLNWEVVREQQASGAWASHGRDKLINRALAYGFTREELGLPEWFVPDPSAICPWANDPAAEWFTVAGHALPTARAA